MIFNNPILFFFKERPDFKQHDIALHFERTIADFFALQKDTLSVLKAGVSPELKIKFPERRNVSLLGCAKSSKAGYSANDPDFYGFMSWQPSFSFVPTGSTFKVLRFDHAIWPPALLESASLESYMSFLSLFFETMGNANPAAIVHYRADSSAPLNLYFDSVESFLAFMFYQDDLSEMSFESFEGMVRTADWALQKAAVEKPGTIERKEFGFSMNCLDTDIYSLVVDDLIGTFNTSPARGAEPEEEEDVAPFSPLTLK